MSGYPKITSLFCLASLVSLSGQQFIGNNIFVSAFAPNSPLESSRFLEARSRVCAASKRRLLSAETSPSSTSSSFDDPTRVTTTRIIDTTNLSPDVVESLSSSSIDTDDKQQQEINGGGWVAPTMETLVASEAAAMVFSLTTPEEVGLAKCEPSTSTETSSSSPTEASPTRTETDTELLLINMKEAAAEDFVHVLGIPQPTSTEVATMETTAPNSPNKASGPSASPSLVVPTYRKLAIFSATTILIWLSEPLLSLVDTTVMGLQPQSMLALAAVGPATTLYDSAVYLCYFLAMAATNQLTAAHAKGDFHELQKHTSHILGVSSVLGIAVSVFLVIVGPRLLGASTTEWWPLAAGYVSIRGTVACMAIIGSVLQAFLLASQNTTTPFFAVIAAAITNTVGDLLLAPKFGLAGVAAATATSTVVSTTILFCAVRKQMLAWRKQEENQKQLDLAAFDDESAIKKLKESFLSTLKVCTTKLKSTRNEQSQQIPLFSIPDSRSLLQLVRLAGPLFFVYVAKVVCFSALTIRCTSLGSVPLAAHSIMMRVFFFFACFGDSLSQTAQSFLPATLIQQDDGQQKRSNAEFKEVMKRISMIALLFGAVNGQAIVTMLKHCSRFLTHDKAIQQCMTNPVALACIGATTWMHPLYMMLEGSTVAQGQLKTITRSYAFTLALQVGLLSLFGGSFTSIWKIFTIFQATRLSQLAMGGIIRPWLKQRKQHHLHEKLHLMPLPDHA